MSLFKLVILIRGSTLIFSQNMFLVDSYSVNMNSSYPYENRSHLNLLMPFSQYLDPAFTLKQGPVSKEGPFSKWTLLVDSPHSFHLITFFLLFVISAIDIVQVYKQLFFQPTAHSLWRMCIAVHKIGQSFHGWHTRFYQQ